MTAIAGQSLGYAVTVFVALLAGALLVGVVAERMRIPYTVALVAAGLVVSFAHGAYVFDFRAGLLFLFLPPLLFEAAWNLEINALRRTWRSITWLAVPGVLITVLIVAGLLAVFRVFDWTSGLVLGAIVSATDPVAVIPTFRRISVPHELQTIVEGESLANDGMAAVLFTALVGFAATGAGPSVPVTIWEALAATAGGIGIGVVSGYLLAILMRRTPDSDMRTVATILAAYGSYAAADYVHVSGIFATIAAGIALRAFLRERNDSIELVRSFWGALALLANSLVFLLMGLRIDPNRLDNEPLPILAAVIAVVASRAIVALSLPRFREVPRWGHGWRRVIALAGMRGGLALALALSLPVNLAHRPQIIDAVFAIVAFSTLGLGLTIGPMVKRADPTVYPAES